MKTMLRSFLILVLVFSLCFSLAACGKDPSNDGSGNESVAGEKGEKGDKGDTGAEGPQGEKGDKGDTGAEGPQGEKGDKGDTGAQGPQGEKGDKGDTGAQGPQGEKGDKGDTGAEGPQGEKGDKGDTGAQGPQGATGATIEKIEFDENGNLIITLTDKTVLGPIEMPEKEEHIHRFGEWIAREKDASIYCSDRLYYRICLDCKIIEWRAGNYDDHTLDAKYSYDSENHWIECDSCDAKDSLGNHTVDDSGFCTVCDNPIGITHGLEYESSLGGGYLIITGYEGTSKRVNIPDEIDGLPVKAIKTAAFENKFIRSVVLPEGITTIGQRAFAGCASLAAITIPESVTEIGYAAFSNCTNLTEIRFNAASMNDLSDYQFVFDRAGTEGEGIRVIIGKSVTKIPAYLFCPAYDNGYIQNGENPNATKIVSLEFEEGGSCEKIGERAFAFCDLLSGSLYIPGCVETIGKEAFQYCEGITSVEVANGVAVIEEGAFRNCTELESVMIGASVTSIGERVFLDTPSLIRISVDSQNLAYKDIDGNLYSKDGRILIKYATGKNETSFTVPDGVETIGILAFRGAESLESVSIPNTVTKIDASAFAVCTGLVDVIFEEGCQVSVIEHHAFFECTSLVSITIPKSVKTIGYNAFEGSKNLETVKFESGCEITAIPEYCFNGCESLKNIVIPDSVLTIG